jgi:N-acetyl-beta-hexosaminidase
MINNKMSVNSDSHSFPLETPRVPELTKYGAYSSRHVYKKTDVQALVEYARHRGIRVLLEFDNPSHAGEIKIKELLKKNSRICK